MVPRFLTLAAAGLASLAACAAAAATGSWPAGLLGLAVAAATALRPSMGLMLVAAFAPLGGAVAALAHLRTSWTEALLLAVLAGWLMRRTLWPERWDTRAARLATLFGLVVLTSLLIDAVLAHQLTSLESRSFPRGLVESLTAFAASPRQGPRAPQWTAAWRLLGGVGLFVMTVEICRRSADAADRSLRLLTLGAAAVAALNVSRFVEIVIRRGGDLLPTAMEFHRTVRISSTIADVNAAGAMFALLLPAAAAQCLRPGRRLAGALALAALVAGLWLTGSRAAMVGGVVALAAYIIVVAQRQWTRAQAVVGVGLLAVTLAGLVVWYPRGAAHTATSDAWLVREYLAAASFRMARESPAFGVGIGRFRSESTHFAPAALQRYYHAENAHNQVLQLLGELGLPGAALFLALVAISLVTGAGAGRDPVVFGVLGWLLASLLMHPLLVPEASAAFWLVLGLARAAAPQPTERPARRWETVGSAAIAIGLLAAVPTRVAALRHGLDLDGVGVGLSAWRRDGEVRYRTAPGATAIYVEGRPGRLRVPLRLSGGLTSTAAVDVWLDGRPAGSLTVASDRWAEFSTLLPPAGRTTPRFRRLDFRWTPTAGARLEVGRESSGAARDPL